MTVLLGFMDGQGRAYDLNFRTLKRRMRETDGPWTVEPGEGLSAGTSLECAVFLESGRPHLLLRPTAGTAYTSGKRLLFLAGDSVPRTREEPTTFNVSFRVPPSAVDHLFREMGGRELVEVRREEILGAGASRAELTLRIEAPWVGGEQPSPFLLVLRPLVAARAAVSPLGLPTGLGQSP